jgi:hypothetical protein
MVAGNPETPAGRVCAVCLLKKGRVERGAVYGPLDFGESRPALNAGLLGLTEDEVPAALLRGAACLLADPM